MKKSEKNKIAQKKENEKQIIDQPQPEDKLPSSEIQSPINDSVNPVVEIPPEPAPPIELNYEYDVPLDSTTVVPKHLSKESAKLPIWEEYGARCIGCGRCNFVCPTCTCFTMQDIFYKDNPKAGERRRVWASCQVDGYSDIAGGHSFRQSQGERMRFKVLHKISDYKKRFGYHMCVGCGRYENVCPEYISYIACLQKLKEKEGK
jgi:sulfite reductase subunit A